MRNKGKKNLTKEILAENINRQFGLTKSFSEKLINSLIFHLTNTVKTDKILKIKNFGTFRILNKKERVGRNPKSKENSRRKSLRPIKMTLRRVISKRKRLYRSR